MSYQKVTVGYVVQKYDDLGNPVSQWFVAGDDVSYEDEVGEPIDVPSNEQYLPFNMEQPESE